MSAVETLRNYRVTLILDSRGLDEGIEALQERYGELLKSLGSEVKEASHERRDFIRVTDRAHTGDYYLTYQLEGPTNLQTRIQQETELDNVVKRFFVESL